MVDAHFPDQLKYHPEHAWVSVDGEVATIGISWFAQDALGEVIFFDPPQVGAEISAGESAGELESLKAVSEVIAPISGRVIEVNTALEGSPEPVNGDPYGAGWLLKVQPDDGAELARLLDCDAYQASLS